MTQTIRKPIYEFTFFLILFIGLVAFAHAQTPQQSFEDADHQKRVRVQVEITENGKTSTSIQEMELNRESINGQLEEMVEEIEMILEEAVQDIEETDLEITIKRNTFATPDISQDNPHYRTFMSVIPEGPARHHVEDRPQAFLGVFAEPVHEEELTQLGLSKAVRLNNVVEESAADKAGLESGNIIKSIGGHEVGDFAELADAIRSFEPGETVSLEVIRDGLPETLEVTLGENSGRYFRFKSENKPFLGVRGHNVDDGAYIESIIPGTAAEEVGLLPADVITAIDGVEINSLDDLRNEMRTKEVKDEVEISILRNNEEIKVNAKLGAKPYESAFVFGHEADGQSGSGYNYSYSYDYDFDFEDDSESAFLGIAGKTTEKGVVVTKVFDGTSADKIALQEGDVIRAMDGKKIEDIDELVEHLRELEPGDELKVTYERNGEKHKESVSLGSKSAYYRSKKESCNQVQKIVMHVRVEDLKEEEIEDLSKKTGENLDASNSLPLEDLQFSPNPTTGQFKIMFDTENTGDTGIKVFDQNGQMVLNQELKEFSGIYSNQFDISDQPSGVYFISITQNGMGRTARVVKQ